MEQTSPLRLVDGSHVVQFYESEHSLVGVVGAYLAASLHGGDRVLVIASGDHRARFEEALGGSGVDIKRCLAEGRLVVADAGECLSRFMLAGSPSPRRFDATIGSMARQLAASGAPVRAYGEMVAQLWANGNVTGAVEVERLWNDLSASTPLGLFCTYPLDLVDDVGVSDAFSAVCDLHSHVVGGAPDPPGAELSRRFVADPRATRLARRYVSSTLGAWGLASMEADAVIVAGELVANAVVHGGRQFCVGLARRPEALRIMVSDSSRAAPRVCDPPTLESDGRGLRIVGTMSSEWSFDLHDGGKVVSAELPIRAADRNRVVVP